MCLYSEGYEDDIVGLLDTVFGGWPHLDVASSKVDYWRWKHLDNPAGRSVVLVAVKDQRLIGSNHSMPVRVKVGGRERLAVVAADLAVHPDHRRMGVRTAMRERKLEYLVAIGTSFTQSVSGNPIIVEHSLRENLPRFPHPVAAYVRIKDLDLHLRHMPVDNAWVKRAGYHALRALKIIGRGVKDAEAPHGVDVVEVERFDERVDGLWSSASQGYDYIGFRDRVTLNWRYCDPRVGGCKVLYAVEGGELSGYVVLRVNRFFDDYPVGFIVDILTDLGRNDVVNALLVEANKYFDDEGVNIVNALAVKGSAIEKALGVNGYLDSVVRLEVFLRPIIGGEASEMAGYGSDRMLFTWGDHDSLPLNAFKQA